MPTPSDGTANPAKSYAEMANAAEECLAEEQRQVNECCQSVQESHQRSIPHGMGSDYGKTPDGPVTFTERDESGSGDGDAGSSPENY
jgi:hypothetical protein